MSQSSVVIQDNFGRVSQPRGNLRNRHLGIEAERNEGVPRLMQASVLNR